MSSQPLVLGLGYLVVYADELEPWDNFATQVLGMSARSVEPGLLLRMDDRVARIIVRRRSSLQREAPRHGYTVGWECANAAQLSKAASAVEGSCVVEELPANEWRREAVRYTDPAGVECELFYGAKVDPADHFVSPTGANFVMGPQGLGHVTVSTSHCEEMVDFYAGRFGFQVRETNRSANGWRWAFLSPGEREHSLAVMNTGGDGALMHLLVEVDGLDTVGRALDKCFDRVAPLSVSLGRHWNDQMVSFYVHSPSGFDVEYGCSGRRVDSAHWSERAQGGSGAVSLWGHRVVLPDGTLGAQIGAHRPGGKRNGGQ